MPRMGKPPPPPESPPLGKCFGGVLSEDPLHCYVLERAQKRKVIEVEKIYLVGNVLHLSIEGDQVGDKVYQLLKDQSYSFYDRCPQLGILEP